MGSSALVNPGSSCGACCCASNRTVAATDRIINFILTRGDGKGRLFAEPPFLLSMEREPTLEVELQRQHDKPAALLFGRSPEEGVVE